MQNRFHMVDFLIQRGAPLNTTDDFGDTPLHRSLELAKDYNISRILIENGADLCNRNVDGETPLHTHFSSVIEQVLLVHACLPDYNVRDSRGKTLLHHLAWSSRTSCATFERVSQRSGRMHNNVDGEQKSVLHYAAQRGNIAVVDYLLAHRDPNINTKDNTGRTPLHCAIESSRSSAVIKLLASHGAEINARDNGGRSALHLAAQRDKEAAVRALVGTGLSNEVSIEGYPGQTCRQTAKKMETRDVLTVTHAIDLRRRGWPVSDEGSRSSEEAPKRELDLRDSREYIGGKEGHVTLLRRCLSGLMSHQRITTAGVETLRQGLIMSSCVVLLGAIWLLGKVI